MKNLAAKFILSLVACSISILTNAQGDDPFEPTIESIGKHQTVNCLSAPSLIGVTISPSHSGYVYIWNTGETDSVITVAPSQSTNYSLQIQNSELGINVTKHFSVTVKNDPIITSKATYLSDKNTCKGTPLTIEPIFTGGYAPYSLMWEDQSTGRTTVIEPYSDLKYNVTITDACGSSEVASIDVTVSEHDPLIIPNDQILTYSCDGDKVLLKGALNEVAGGVGYGYQYTLATWDKANIPIEVEATDGATYELIYTDACEEQTKSSIITLSKEEIELPNADAEMVCQGDLVEITEETKLGRLYYWNNGEMQVNFTEQIHSNTTFDLTFIDRCGEGHSVPKEILVSEVESDFEYDVHAKIDQVELNASNLNNDYKYSWIIDGVAYSNEDKVIANLKAGSTHEVTLVTENDLGCKRGVTKAIIVRDNISIPTAFSPNGDGHNDFFFIASDEPFLTFNIEIFDRWGQRIFHSSDQYFRWGGNRNTPNELNTYVYVIKGKSISGGSVNETGTLTVMN